MASSDGRRRRVYHEWPGNDVRARRSGRGRGARAAQAGAPRARYARRAMPADAPRLSLAARQTFFCGGRLVAGPAWSSLIGTSALILAPSGIFLGLVVPDVAREYSWALLAFGLWLPLFSVAALLVTGCSDPGIIPRIPPPQPDEFPEGRPRCAARGHAPPAVSRNAQRRGARARAFPAQHAARARAGGQLARRAARMR
jgi:hypothetical protein